MKILRRTLVLFLLFGAAGAAALRWPSISFHLASCIEAGAEAGNKYTRPEIDGDKGSLNFLAVGDTGHGTKSQRQVADAMAISAKIERSEFVLMLGDNFYEEGVDSVEDEAWLSSFENIYRSRLRNIPFYACLGNHDHLGNISAQIRYTDHSSRWRMPAAYYSFTKQAPDGATVEIIVIDTDSLIKEREGSDEQLRWLKRTIRSSTADWKILAGHHPLRSGGRPSNKTRELRQKLGGLLDEHRVDLYLCGHDHYLEIGSLDNGIPYAISGAGSTVQKKAVHHSHAEFGARELGFLWIRVTKAQLDIELVNRSARPIYGKTIFSTP